MYGHTAIVLLFFHFHLGLRLQMKDIIEYSQRQCNNTKYTLKQNHRFSTA